MNALNVKLVKAHWHEHADLFNHKGSVQSTVLQVALPVGEASVLTHFLRRQNWRATGMKKVMTVSTPSHDQYSAGQILGTEAVASHRVFCCTFFSVSHL